MEYQIDVINIHVVRLISVIVPLFFDYTSFASSGLVVYATSRLECNCLIACLSSYAVGASL